MPSVGFEPTISEDERPQTYVLDRAATGTGVDTNAFYILRQVLSASGTAVAQWLGAVLQVGRSLVRFQLVSLDFSLT